MPFKVVSVCCKDPAAESNPFWHMYLALSEVDPTNNKLRIAYTWGFYGVPPTTKPDSMSAPARLFYKGLAGIGIETDMKGNHGMLVPEKLRQLELGRGLHSVSFEVSDELYEKLRLRCDGMYKDQYAAIDEAAAELKLEPLPAGAKMRYHKYEHVSDKIFQHEAKKAQAQTPKRETRLHEFVVALGPNDNSCKMRIIAILDGILSKQHLEYITGWYPSQPRASGRTELTYWHSAGGPLHDFVHPKTKAFSRFRSEKDPDSRVYWTVPPQLVFAKSRELLAAFKIHEDHCDAVKIAVRQLQALELLLRNAQVTGKDIVHRDNLIKLIVKHYEVFSSVVVKKAAVVPENDLTNFFKWLAAQPRDEGEATIMKKLKNAQEFLNSVYMAIVDGWAFSSKPPETLVDEKDSKAVVVAGDQKDAKASGVATEPKSNSESYLKLLANMPEDLKRKCCAAMNRGYTEICELDDTDSDEDEKALSVEPANPTSVLTLKPA